MSDRLWTFEEKSRNVHIFRVEVPRERGWSFEPLCISDIHWDNPHCDRDLLKKHLDEAVERDVPILINGDFFCAMQGKWDKRSSKRDLRPEHADGDYLDLLVSTAAEWLDPYKNHIAVIGDGNHETAILKRHETNLLDRLCAKLRDRGGITRYGGYSGWLRFRFWRDTDEWRQSKTVYYHHGAGGGAPVTKGAIQFNRLSEQVVADVFWLGHIHRQNTNADVRAKLNHYDQIVLEDVLYMRTGTYKEEFRDGARGYHNEGMRGPRPLGGYWLRFVYGAHKRMEIYEARTER